MSYLSLYRRRRPLNFKDMTGQEHITRTLSNALCSDHLAHAYLFCGPRGTGKTTAAKILSRAMNCEQYPVAEPCGKCVPCKNIAAGVSIDVIEMDAASNRGIDEIRELRERSRFASGESRYKVYIIDEAHMLTPEACNAFLKTLEEPPPNVVFILATTDPSRLPSTIVSRCQRFDFHLLTVDQIRQHLEHILEQENWQADSEAVTLIARLADGSLRDALGILEQCSAYGEEKIEATQVRIVTGATMIETIGTLVKAAVENDLDTGLSIIEQVVYSGRDLNLFIRDLTFIFTRLLLENESNGKQAGSNAHGFEQVVSRYHGKVEKHLLLDAVELLHEVSSELRHAHFPQYILEVAFIRLIRLLHGRLKPVSVLYSAAVQQPDPDTAKITQNAEMTADRQKAEDTREGKAQSEAERHERSRAADAEKRPGPAEDTSDVAGKEAVENHTAKFKEAWPRILQEIKRRQKSTAAWLDPAVLGECRGNMVRLEYSSEYTIHQIRILENSHRKTVEEVFSAFCGVPVTIKAEIVEGEVKRSSASGKAEPVTDPDSASDSAPDVGPKEEKERPKTNKSTGAEEAMELFGGKLIDSE